jgi:UDP-N-acetylmuramoyl-L-alanyl-D-glutamate--2,6-diaminopimelate ligase
MDALVFLNLAPEHIESHGSYAQYADAKYELGLQLVRSCKRPRSMVANAEDEQSMRYLALPVEHALSFALSQSVPYQSSDIGGTCTFYGITITTHLPGEFSLKNALAAATVTKQIGISTEHIQRGIEQLTRIPGRAETVDVGQSYRVVVDYAHTPDSLTALYEAYKSHRIIAVLGSTGGGRDGWKRPVMGAIAESYTNTVILTNEDPYDEDPQSIIKAVARDMKRTPIIILDRREAIRYACAQARPGDAVLITGKGTDPCICGPNGTKIPWSDAQVAREEIQESMKTVIG